MGDDNPFDQNRIDDVIHGRLRLRSKQQSWNEQKNRKK